MVNHIDRSEQIKRGKFSIFGVEENPEFSRLKSMIPKNDDHRETLLKQLKDAFIFKDKGMIEEISTFISGNYNTQLEFKL